MHTPPGEFIETEVSGIRTLHLPAPGCTRLTLHVGVGWADEAFVTRGVTHAIEHLVMGAAEPGRLESNACVTPFQTAFWANGQLPRLTTAIAPTVATSPHASGVHPVGSTGTAARARTPPSGPFGAYCIWSTS